MYIYNHVHKDFFKMILDGYDDRQILSIDVCQRLRTRYWTQVDISMIHRFAVEKEAFKRDFLMKAHTTSGNRPSFCLFGDVDVFKNMRGWCYSCECEHAVPGSIDFLAAGTSCKKVSKENLKHGEYAQCSWVLII